MKHISALLDDESLLAPVARVSTGFVMLDAALGGGFVPGALYVLAAETSGGKSLIALNVLLRTAAQGTPAMLITLEDGPMIVVRKMLCATAGIELQSVMDARLDQGETEKVKQAHEHLRQLPIQISDAPTLSDIKKQVQAFRQDHMGQLVVIDQTSHVLCEGANKFDRTSIVSRELQRLAVDQNVSILALHQFNRRAAEDRPGLHHLRDSGTVEQDARGVLLITEINRNILKPSEPAILTLEVAKHSYGPRNVECKLVAHYALQRVEDYAGEAI